MYSLVAWLLLSLSLSLSLSSCSKNDNVVPEKDGVVDRLTLTHEEAVKYKYDVTGTYRLSHKNIFDAVSNFDSETKGEQLSVVKIDSSYVVIKEGVDSAFYFTINQIKNGKKGYSIVSGDDRFPGVLCYVEKGELSDTIHNGALALTLKQIPSVIKNQIENYNKWSDSISIVTRAAIPENVVRETCTYLGQTATTINEMYCIASLTTSWHQNYPYNSILPLLSNGRNAYAGCSIIAVAQIMAYHKRNGMLGLSTNDWNYMTATPYAPSNSKIAELIKEIFDNINCGYDESGTKSNIVNVRNYLSNFFNVDSTPQNDLGYDFNTIGNTNLPATPFFPTYMRGNSAEGGHAWVVDGKKIERSDIYDEYVQYIDGKVEPIYHRFHLATYKRDYISCNWGWGDSSAWLSDFIFGGTSFSRNLQALNFIY